MNIYKLKYTNKETAIKDLLKKGVYVETTFNDVTSLTYGTGIHAVVEIGLIVLENGTYDEGLNEGLNEGLKVIKEPIYADGHHFDIMSEQEIDFGSNSIEVNNPRHEFAGHSKVTEPLILPNEI
jgi:hypothetical protein